MTLSDTQRAILTAAAQHPEHLAIPPDRLPAGARQKVAQALLKQDLATVVDGAGYDTAALWPVVGEAVLLKITAAGMAAIGGDPAGRDMDMPAGVVTAVTEGGVALASPDCPTGAAAAQADSQGPTEASTPQHSRMSLREAAQGVLAAWDAGQDCSSMDAAITALRSALVGKPPREPRQPRDVGAPRKPREGTKQEQVLAMLRRPEGATVVAIAEATGWQHHTVRGFFAGLKKRQGITVEVAERVRQVGVDGAKGSYTIYRIGHAG